MPRTAQTAARWRLRSLSFRTSSPNLWVAKSLVNPVVCEKPIRARRNNPGADKSNEKAGPVHVENSCDPSN